jgi:hypothetical protein
MCRPVNEKISQEDAGNAANRASEGGSANLRPIFEGRSPHSRNRKPPATIDVPHPGAGEVRNIPQLRGISRAWPRSREVSSALPRQGDVRPSPRKSLIYL